MYSVRCVQRDSVSLGAVTPPGRKDTQQPVRCQPRSSLSPEKGDTRVSGVPEVRGCGEGTGVRHLPEWAHTAPLPR